MNFRKPATFNGTLAKHLEFGHVLEICARTLRQNANWFLINLSTDKKILPNNTKINTGLQILVDVKTNAISFNKWNNEQIKCRCPSRTFLEEFKILIVFSEEYFHVAINNTSCAAVKYEMPINLLNTIKIIGHLDYIKQVDHRRYLPDTWPPFQISEKHFHFSNYQPMSFEPGHVMILKMQLFGNSNGRFTINFRNAQDDQILELHVSVCFDKKQILRNSNFRNRSMDNISLKFGKEETYGGFPFDNFEKPFKLAIALTESEFQIAKDGEFFCKYLYRTKNVLPNILGVEIFGINDVDVRVSSVHHMKLNDHFCLDFKKYSI